MGMFDRIRVDMKLPGYSEVTDDEFQTKDLDCYLDDYVISANREIYREFWEIHEITGEQIHRRDYLTNLNKTINFYNSTSPNAWRDYYAEVRNGKVVRIWYEDKQF